MHAGFSTAVLIVCASAQFAFAHTLREVRADIELMPPPPAGAAIGASAFGDTQFLYRQLVFDLQNFGDTGGRVTAMRSYDIERVLAWLRALDALDPAAAHHPFLAIRYFSQTPEPGALRRLVEDAIRRAEAIPSRHAIWLAAAIYIAQARLKDSDLALEAADVIDRTDPAGVPLIVRQLPAFLRERAGDYAGAQRAMARVLESRGGRVSSEENTYMAGYIQQMKLWSASPPAPGSPRPASLNPPAPGYVTP